MNKVIILSGWDLTLIATTFFYSGIIISEAIRNLYEYRKHDKELIQVDNDRWENGVLDNINRQREIYGLPPIKRTNENT